MMLASILLIVISVTPARTSWNSGGSCLSSAKPAGPRKTDQILYSGFDDPCSQIIFADHILADLGPVRVLTCLPRPALCPRLLDLQCRRRLIERSEEHTSELQ